MMMPLPYCPATVSRIRDAAPVMSAGEIAQLIGWDGPQVERIAKRHGIEISGAKNGAAVEDDLVIDSEPASLGRTRLHSQITVEGAVGVLRAHPPGEWITAREIANRLHLYTSNADQIVRHRLAHRDVRARYNIEGRIGGGFRIKPNGGAS